MGIKKMFQKKEPTEEEIKNSLTTAGITTKGGNARQEKFGAFRQYAVDRGNKPGLAPVNPYANVQGGPGGANPYGVSGGDNAPNPYTNGGQEGANPYGSSTNGANPYSSSTNRSSQGVNNPYSGGRSNPYEAQPGGRPRNQGQAKTGSDPYAQTSRSNSSSTNPYSKSASNPYSANTSRSRSDVYSTNGSSESFRSADPYGKSKPSIGDDASTLDLNRIPTYQPFESKKPARRPSYDEETLDLNDLPEDEDLNLNIDEDLPEEDEVNSEDEEVEAIKQDIRFVKQESLASTRNTLRMAQEADASGTNTMGMLGSQSERLYNAEQNLLLADTQTQIADSKVKELKRLNRSIFIPANGNPFNKKSRLRQQEERIKSAKAQEKYMRETNRREMYASEQRLKSGITNNATNSEIHQKYQGERDLAAAQRYQFENDSEDDEIEKELAGNLDQIALYAKKLKSTANIMGQEVDSQNGRLKQIEEDADRLDINVHMNSTRLANIR